MSGEEVRIDHATRTVYKYSELRSSLIEFAEEAVLQWWDTMIAVPGDMSLSLLKETTAAMASLIHHQVPPLLDPAMAEQWLGIRNFLITYKMHESTSSRMSDAESVWEVTPITSGDPPQDMTRGAGPTPQPTRPPPPGEASSSSGDGAQSPLGMNPEDLLAALAAQRTADMASLGERIAAHFPEVFRAKPHSEDEVWGTICALLQDLKEAARRIEQQAEATRSRAESAQKEAGWANRRARSAQTKTDLATRGQRTVDQIEWSLAESQFGILKELPPIVIGAILRQEFHRVTYRDTTGKAVTVYTDRGTFLNTVRRVVQLLTPVNKLALGDSERGIANLLWPLPIPPTPGSEKSAHRRAGAPDRHSRPRIGAEASPTSAAPQTISFGRYSTRPPNGRRRPSPS